jgi:serine/threonine protein kinase
VNPDSFQEIEKLYNDALVLSPDERAGFLDSACGSDVDLRKEVESLLAYQNQAESYMEKPAFQAVAQVLADEGAGLQVNRMLGRYHLLSLIGRGGMGEVYCAVDTRLNRLVAVKILPMYFASDPERVRRFEQEARAIAGLNHSSICTLHDVGSDDGLHYLVFEYLVGERLTDRLSRDRFSLTEALDCAIQIAEALAYAHELGVIHLDLKPANIMLMRSGLKLLDFGVAEIRYPEETAGGSDGEPGSRSPGTRGYMAPEQSDGGSTDTRTDVFAFGVVLYEMVAGRRAFPSSIPPAETLKTMPPPVSESRPEVPPALDALVSRCLAMDPAARWQSMSDVLAGCKDIRRMLVSVGN